MEETEASQERRRPIGGQIHPHPMLLAGELVLNERNTLLHTHTYTHTFTHHKCFLSHLHKCKAIECVYSTNSAHAHGGLGSKQGWSGRIGSKEGFDCMFVFRTASIYCHTYIIISNLG